MNIKNYIKEHLFSEAIPKPITKVVSLNQYGDEQPDVSFKQKKYLYSISPQVQVGVTGYARLLDLGNIQINSDDEEAKKIIEDWNDNTNFKTKLENMCNTFLVCGNSILEKLDDKNIQDVAEVDMTSIIAKKRDDFGNTLYYVQQTVSGQKNLGETNLKRYIEFNLSTTSREVWSPCIFESAAIPRKVGNRVTLPLIELVVGLEDAMSTIVLNNAYPEVYYTFEGANEEELKKETEKIRRKKPGDRTITTKQPKIDLFEAKGQSAYVDYIKYMYKSLSLAVKFPTDILTGDYTSRASSDTTKDLTILLSNSIKRYIATKLKNELYDPILSQNGKNPLKTNLQITFGQQEVVEFTPEIVGKRVIDGQWTVEEGREWDKQNGKVDLFDDDIINNEIVQKEKDEQKKQFDNKQIKPNESLKERANEIKDDFYAGIVHEIVKDDIKEIVESIKGKKKKEIIESLSKLSE